MALLDISVVNAALPVIQGEIGATQAEGTWVSTSYPVAEIVVIPLTAWLERLVGLRRMLLFGAVLFTAFSVVCGMSSDLTTMIVGRVGQGLAGGTMIPAGMTIMAKRLPPSQQSIGMAAFAAAALLARSTGPLFGGWMTDNFSWHYVFFINVPICMGLVALILLGFPPERVDPADRGEADWLGIVGMVLGLGTLTVVLEEGHREQWFESAMIWQLTIAGAIGFVLIALGQLRARDPVLKLSLLRDRALSAAMLLMAVNGAILFSTLFTVPQFLAAIAGYTAFQAGMVLLVAGVVSILGAVVSSAGRGAARLARDRRWRVPHRGVRLVVRQPGDGAERRGAFHHRTGDPWCRRDLHRDPAATGGDFSSRGRRCRARNLDVQCRAQCRRGGRACRAGELLRPAVAHGTASLANQRIDRGQRSRAR